MNEKERKSCIFTIKTLMNLAYNIHGVMDVVDVDNCKKIIEMFDSGNLAGRWIPVSERLPEEHDSVFAKFKGTLRWNKSMFEKMSKSVIVTSEFEDGSRIAEKAYTVDGVWNLEVKGVSRKVIAWMPFPEPYQEGEQE